MKKSIVFLLVLSFSISVYANQRNQLFLKKIRTFTNKQDSVNYARTEIKNKRSPFRIDAIEFLREIKDVESVEFLADFVNDKDINTFIIYALGDLKAYETTTTLINLLNHPNPNVRGNAFAALGKIYPMSLPQGYVYDQPEVRRKRNVRNIVAWWKTRGEKLTENYQRDLNKDEKEKERLWEKYGKNYLHGKSN